MQLTRGGKRTGRGQGSAGGLKCTLKVDGCLYGPLVALAASVQVLVQGTSRNQPRSDWAAETRRRLRREGPLMWRIGEEASSPGSQAVVGRGRSVSFRGVA
jgi:hypothetical protein